MSGPKRYHRRSIRLKDYDYAQSGAYFVTVCAHGRKCLFGEVVEFEMHLNDAGRMVQDVWDALPQRYPEIELDAFVVMPNHIHGILVVTEDPEGATTRIAPTRDNGLGGATGAWATTRVAPTVGDRVGAFKSITTVSYIHGVKKRGWPQFNRKIWQRNYHEHIIRCDESLERIRRYIVDNPAQWSIDRENPDSDSKATGAEPWCV